MFVNYSFKTLLFYKQYYIILKSIRIKRRIYKIWEKDMKITIGKTAVFCPGVRNAVEKAKEALKIEDKIYCLGEIVHNKQVIQTLEKNGMITVENIDEIPIKN